jgi:hypothetical protein
VEFTSVLGTRDGAVKAESSLSSFSGVFTNVEMGFSQASIFVVTFIAFMLLVVLVKRHKPDPDVTVIAVDLWRNNV